LIRTNALNIGRQGQGRGNQQQDRERLAASGTQESRQRAGGPQQPLGGDQGRVELFAGRGTAVPANAGERVSPNEAYGEMRPARATGRERPEASSAPPAHEPGNVGHPQRQRPEQTAIADVDDQTDDGGQRGTTRAVRVTKPNRKKRVA
jgi:hypothetical protein